MTRYTITFHDKPGAKNRYRAALKMMGAESVTIAEKEVDASTPEKKPDTIPTSPVAKAVADLFGRKHSTEWADEEIEAYKRAVKSTLLTLENVTLVAKFYKTERKKEDNYCRTSILTFCRHFGTELDKARAVKPSGDKSLEWTDSRPKIEVLPDPAEVERIRADARAKAEEFRKSQGGAA